MKRFLFVMRQLPHSGIKLQEQLDVILTTAAFDQKVSLLFLDNGVFQLKKQQQAQHYGLKDTLAIFNALSIYDIQQLYVEIESLRERGLKTADLALPVVEIYRKDFAVFSQQFDFIG